ncbi:hypothetical protein PUN28_016984 [Cardiocondyla obscurior]|uniref:HAT C-terminal dimerisation domain-containing protein n=1 Tax=Cardiocondyla obscurior TaxID=286306 RepID=A0AAW2EM53_9HYME
MTAQSLIDISNLDINNKNKILIRSDFNEEKIFPNLKQIVVVFSFPHSNAEAERIFSMINDIKSKKRNRLANNTPSALCVVRSSFQAEGTNCVNFEIHSRHLKLHNAQNLYSDQCTSDEAE